MMEYPGIEHLTKELVAARLKTRAADSHKGNYGHALLIAGSKGRMGAAVLAARACLRTGAGLLTVNIPFAERSILQSAIPEAMLVNRRDAKNLDAYTCIGIGPAIGTTAGSFVILKAAFQSAKPVVIDADALTLLGAHKKAWPHVPADSILTPHPKEFERLFGKCANHEERMQKAIAASTIHPWVIVLKNYQTLIVYNGKAYLNSTGNPGLAKGGSGDILTGMITALVSQGYSSFDAALLGVYLHGSAADIAVQHQSPESLLATDVAANIGKAYTQLRTP